MRWRSAVLLAALSSPAIADVFRDDGIIDRYAVRPLHRTPTTALHVELEMSGCIPVAPTPAVLTVEGQSVRFGVLVHDYCDPSLDHRVQTYEIGMLPTGAYEIAYLLCVGAPLPAPNPARWSAPNHFPSNPAGRHRDESRPALRDR